MSTIKEIKFVYTFTEEETERLRVSVLKSKGQILKFVVQLEIKIGNFWKPIVRYDTAHGYSHKDIIRADGSIEKQPLIFEDFNIAFTFGFCKVKNGSHRMAQKNTEFLYKE